MQKEEIRDLLLYLDRAGVPALDSPTHCSQAELAGIDPSNVALGSVNVSYLDEIAKIRERKIFPTMKGCDPLSFDNVCIAAFWACRDEYHAYEVRVLSKGAPHFGEDGIWGDACFHPGRPLLLNHSERIILARKVMNAASVFFYDHVKDPAALNRCCGTDSKCRNRYSATELYTLDGLPDGDHTSGFYDADANRVYFSSSYLLGNLDENVIRSVVSHELGHACQFARNPNLKIFENCDSEKPADDVVGVFGLEVYDCLKTSLANPLPQWKSGGESCHSSHLAEAFADLISAADLRNPASFAHLCHSHADGIHANPNDYMDCILRDPAVMKNLCGH